MGALLCPVCSRPVGNDPRAKYCSSRCRWRHYWQRSIRSAAQVQELPLAVLPMEAEELLPAGNERGLVAMQLALIGRAPAGARGYRVGIKHRLSQTQRWFPAAQRVEVPMFMLEPFEWPAVPVAGVHAVVYLDGHCSPIGGPRFSVAIDQIDRRLCYSHGDRTYKPRVK